MSGLDYERRLHADDLPVLDEDGPDHFTCCNDDHALCGADTRDLAWTDAAVTCPACVERDELGRGCPTCESLHHGQQVVW
jgi:hypothetical protein